MSSGIAGAYVANLAAAVVVALALTLLALSWFDLIGYLNFLASLRNA